MPVINKIGDIFQDDEIHIICHQANVWNTLLKRTSSGIAAQIEKRYPEAADADKDLTGDAKIGTYSTAVGKDGKRIVNVYSQIGRATSYDAIFKVFFHLENIVRQFNETHPTLVKNIAIPYGYGANIAIGKFKMVKAIMEVIFGDSLVKLIIVRLPTQGDLE